MPRRATLLLLVITCTALAYALLSPPWLFPRQDQSMRLCFPLRFDKFVPPWVKRPASCQSSVKMSNGNGTSSGTLVGFLKEQRREFLKALDSGNANGWVVVMGNEAGGEYRFVAASLTDKSQTSIPSHLQSHTLRSPHRFRLNTHSLSSLHHGNTCPFDRKTPSHCKRR
jgi:hypothetical protein